MATGSAGPSIDPAPRLTLEYPGCPASCRLIDLFCPIGRGQRGLIVSPPKAGKTTLLKDIATAILRNHPDVEVVVLLVDERPEEVTDFRRTLIAQIAFHNFVMCMLQVLLNIETFALGIIVIIEIIQHGNAVTGRQELVDQVAANETGSACHQNVSCHLPNLKNFN